MAREASPSEEGRALARRWCGRSRAERLPYSRTVNTDGQPYRAVYRGDGRRPATEPPPRPQLVEQLTDLAPTTLADGPGLRSACGDGRYPDHKPKHGPVPFARSGYRPLRMTVHPPVNSGTRNSTARGTVPAVRHSALRRRSLGGAGNVDALANTSSTAPCCDDDCERFGPAGQLPNTA